MLLERAVRFDQAAQRTGKSQSTLVAYTGGSKNIGSQLASLCGRVNSRFHRQQLTERMRKEKEERRPSLRDDPSENDTEESLNDVSRSMVRNFFHYREEFYGT